MSITHSFLELESPDFEWKFVWTVWKNFEPKILKKWPTNHKIDHNSLISWATDSRFCMEVFTDSPNYFCFKNKMAAKKQIGRHIAKLSITHSFLELQTPDFVWKLLWIARRNPWKKINFMDSIKKILKLRKIKEMAIAGPFFSYRLQILHGSWSFSDIKKLNLKLYIKSYPTFES